MFLQLYLRSTTSPQSFKLQMNACHDYLKHSQHLQNSCPPPTDKRKTPGEKRLTVTWETKRCQREAWARIQEAAPNLWTIENPVKSAPILSGMLRIVQVSQHEKQHSNSFILAQVLYLLPKSPWGGWLPGESPWPRAQKTYMFLQRFWFSQVEHCKARSTKGLRASLLIMRLALLSSVLISPTPH